MPLLDGQVHHDTHAVPKGNYVIAVGISLIVSPSEVGNCVIADSWLPVWLPESLRASLTSEGKLFCSADLNDWRLMLAGVWGR